MLCARFPPFAPILRGPSLMVMVLQRGTAGRAAVSTVPHRSRRLARERERQLKKVVSSLSRDEVAGMQRQLRRRLQQEALLESTYVRTCVCCPVHLMPVAPWCGVVVSGAKDSAPPADHYLLSHLQPPLPRPLRVS